jgi:peptidylprolyl isomerase
MDKIRALAAAQSQDVNLIFISHDGETAAMLANSFSEDLGFTNISILKGGILRWLKEDRKLSSHKKVY